MNTLFAKSPDGTRVAYDRSGTGPVIMLLHGGGSNRQEWHEAGYVRRLRDDFTVITLDLRGHGESGLPTDPGDYTTDKMGQDMLAVADACGVKRFTIWGMSYGGKVSRYLAVQSERVAKLILIGTPLGLGVSGERRQEAIDFCAHWPPIVQAQREGTLDLESLSRDDQDFLCHFNVPVMLGWVRAMLDWPVIEPAEFLCPTLWLVGSEDQHAIASLKEYEKSLKGTRVQVHIVEGLDHEQVFIVACLGFLAFRSRAATLRNPRTADARYVMRPMPSYRSAKAGDNPFRKVQNASIMQLDVVTQDAHPVGNCSILT